MLSLFEVHMHRGLWSTSENMIQSPLDFMPDWRLESLCNYC
jgi:hypothetical protein